MATASGIIFDKLLINCSLNNAGSVEDDGTADTTFVTIEAIGCLKFAIGAPTEFKMLPDASRTTPAIFVTASSVVTTGLRIAPVKADKSKSPAVA